MRPLTGDWAGSRISLKEHGITLAPRLTQFYQGLRAGDGDSDFQYGGKVDLMLNADLSKLGFWNGFSVTVHAEHDYGESINGTGGILSPVNTALLFPGWRTPTPVSENSKEGFGIFGQFGISDGNPNRL